MRFIIHIQPKQFEDSFITLLVSNMKSVSIVGGNCEVTEDSFMLSSLEKYLEDNLSNVEVSDDNESHEMFTNVVVHEKSSKEFLSDYLDEIVTTVVKEFNYCQEYIDNLRNSEFSIFTRQIVSRVNKLLETRSHRRNIQGAAFKLKQLNILKTTYFMKKCFRQKLFYFKGERELMFFKFVNDFKII